MIRRAVAEDWEAWLAVHQAVAAEGRWIGAELPLDMDVERRRFHEHVTDDDKALFLAEVVGPGPDGPGGRDGPGAAGGELAGAAGASRADADAGGGGAAAGGELAGAAGGGGASGAGTGGGARADAGAGAGMAGAGMAGAGGGAGGGAAGGGAAGGGAAGGGLAGGAGAGAGMAGGGGGAGRADGGGGPGRAGGGGGAVVVGVLGIHVYRYNVAGFGMAVLDGHRAQGIGSALLSAGIDFAREKGAHKVSLQMWPHNEAGRRLYEKFGFEDEGCLRRHYPRKNGEIWDAVIMGLQL